MITQGWKFITTIPSSEPFFIEGNNIWDYEWESTDETINVEDPLYKQKYVMDVYKISVKGKEFVFAAGEFSNCIYGIYQKIA